MRAACSNLRDVVVGVIASKWGVDYDAEVE